MRFLNSLLCISAENSRKTVKGSQFIDKTPTKIYLLFVKINTLCKKDVSRVPALNVFILAKLVEEATKI